MGVRGVQLTLFKNYLSNRLQRVRVGELTSSDLPINYGVPQGSVLGPTLFLTFINDLCNLQLMNGKIITFADDTALVFHGNSWEEAYDFAQAGFNRVTAWLRNNALTLNIEKTKFIPFSIRNSFNHDNFSLRAHFCTVNHPCHCSKISIAPQIRYLGIIIDSTLSFNSHLDLLSSRTRKLIYVFKNLRHIADKSIIKMVYQSLCQSVIAYCITVWGVHAKPAL